MLGHGKVFSEIHPQFTGNKVGYANVRLAQATVLDDGQFAPAAHKPGDILFAISLKGQFCLGPVKGYLEVAPMGNHRHAAAYAIARD